MVGRIEAEPGEDTVEVRFRLKDKVDVRTFREDNNFVLDVGASAGRDDAGADGERAAGRAAGLVPGAARRQGSAARLAFAGAIPGSRRPAAGSARPDARPGSEARGCARAGAAARATRCRRRGAPTAASGRAARDRHAARPRRRSPSRLPPPAPKPAAPAAGAAGAVAANAEPPRDFPPVQDLDARPPKADVAAPARGPAEKGDRAVVAALKREGDIAAARVPVCGADRGGGVPPLRHAVARVRQHGADRRHVPDGGSRPADPQRRGVALEERAGGAPEARPAAPRERLHAGAGVDHHARRHGARPHRAGVDLARHHRTRTGRPASSRSSSRTKCTASPIPKSAIRCWSSPRSRRRAASCGRRSSSSSARSPRPTAW